MSSHAEHDYENPTLPPRLCQNCQTALRGPYCVKCGQHDVDYHRSFWHLTHDLLENLFHFEGKFFSSVAWLLAKPGRLTADFNAGRRQSQLNPLRFYIFVTVLFFLGVHLLNDGHLFGFDRKKADQLADNVKVSADAVGGALKDLTPEQQEEFGRLLGEHASKTLGKIDEAAIKDILARVRGTEPPPETAATEDAAKPKKKPRPKPEKKRDQSDARDDDTPNINQAFKRKIASGELTFSKMIDAMEQRVPTLLFLGMPIFALLLKLLYWRRKRYYIEHLIFSVHLHTWAFLTAMVATGYFRLAALGPWWIALILGLALPVWMVWYLFAAFRCVYGQRWLKTTIKIGLLGMTYFAALSALTGFVIYLTIYWLVNM